MSTNIKSYSKFMYATFMSTIWNHMACAPSRNVAGSIPDGVIGIFHWHNPSGCTMALGLTQSLIEMSVRNIFWVVKAAGAKGWQPYHLHVPTVMKSRSLNHLETSGTVQDRNGISCRANIYFIYPFMSPIHSLLLPRTMCLHSKLLITSH
jgi:hypothetical protein